MNNVINIHRQDEVLFLEARKYAIDVLGGWGVTLRHFSVSLRSIGNGEIVTAKKAFWPKQSYAFGKRRKSIFTVEVYQRGKYRVEFLNSDSIEVKHSNLFFSSWITEPSRIPKSQYTFISEAVY